MEYPAQNTVTHLLIELQDGNRAVLGELFALVYEELRSQAHRHRVRWHGDYTFNTTALVHETYLKLVDLTQARWDSRVHFLAVAARAMRHILIDYARRRQAEKRGGDVQKLSLEEMATEIKEITMTEERAEVLVSLGEALRRLEKESAREAQVVECRFFGGMTVEETAAALGISERTVKRDWALALAWLRREMQEHGGPSPLARPDGAA